MSLLLHELAHSPFCIAIAQALHACGVAFERREVSSWNRSELLRLTHGASWGVPMLQNGPRMIFERGPETQDVAKYVDEMFAHGALFPPALEGLQGIVLDFLENELEPRTFKLTDIHYIPALADFVDRGMMIRHKERRFGHGCVERWRQDAAALRTEADAHLQRFETALRHAPFLFGEKPIYADFLLFGVLGNLTFHEWNELSAEQSALAAWTAKMRGFRY